MPPRRRAHGASSGVAAKRPPQAPPASPSRTWAQLPGDVLRRIASSAQELPPRGKPGLWGYEPARPQDAPLLLRDVLSAAATCSAWRHGLASFDLRSLTVGSGSAGKLAWVQRARPGARHLRVHASAAGQEGQQLLGCLRGEAVHEAEVARAPACLPDPGRLPALRSLSISCLEWDTAWAARLAHLPLLARLELALAPPAAQRPAGRPMAPPATQHPAGHPMVMPALPALQRLVAYISSGCPPLRLELAGLPVLEELELLGSAQDQEEDRGSAELLAAPAGPGTPPCRLRRLSLDLSRATLDCRGMSALSSVSLWARQVAGGASLGAATGLRRMRLGAASLGFGRTYECALDKGWVCEALGALPQGLRVLELSGTFMSREPLTSLPALRHLLLAIRGSPPAELEGQLRGTLPRLHTLRVGSMMESRSLGAFLRAAGEAESGSPPAAGSEAGSDVDEE